MIKITKTKEPLQWTQYRKTPGAHYQAQDYLTEALMRKQGYICGYCMRRIPRKDKLSGAATQEDHRIEHVKCRTFYPELELDYSNMIACCPGHIGDEDHCDRSKKDLAISFSPMEEAAIESIRYSSSGKIFSANRQWNKEMDEVLNLNTSMLVLNRRSMLDEVIKRINQQCRKKNSWDKALLNKFLQKYSQMHKSNDKEENRMEYYPFCGIVIWFLKDKLRKLG